MAPECTFQRFGRLICNSITDSPTVNASEDMDLSCPIAVNGSVVSDGLIRAYDKATRLPEPVSSALPMKFKLPLQKSGHQTTTKLKRYNNVNIFFMLERQLIFHTLGGDDETFDVDISKRSPEGSAYVNLDLPPLCSRYADLPLSTDMWLMELLAKDDTKHRYAKSHIVPFAEITRIVAYNYTRMDDETKVFVEDVAKRLDVHYDLWNISNVNDELKDKKSNPDLPAQIEHGESRRCKLEGNDAKVGQTKATSQNCNDFRVLPISSELQYCRPTSHCRPTSMVMPPNATLHTHDSSTTKIARLQKELVHAMADKIEAEVKISILRDEIMAEEALQARIHQDRWTGILW